MIIGLRLLGMLEMETGELVCVVWDLVDLRECYMGFRVVDAEVVTLGLAWCMGLGRLTWKLHGCGQKFYLAGYLCWTCLGEGDLSLECQQ